MAAQLHAHPPSGEGVGRVPRQWLPRPLSAFLGPAQPSLTFSPLALLMARRGRSTLSTLRIFTTEMVLDLGWGGG